MVAIALGAKGPNFGIVRALARLLDLLSCSARTCLTRVRRLAPRAARR